MADSLNVMEPGPVLQRGIGACPSRDGEPLRDERDFEDFYVATFDRLVGQLFLVTGDLHDAEDVVQEALARAAVRWPRLRDYDAPEAWVRRVAMNLASDGFRRARRRLAVAVRLRLQADVDPRPQPLEEPALTDALRALPLAQRKVVVLHYLLDLPVDLVAAELAVPVGTVKSRLARARAALAARLAPETRELRDLGGTSNHG
jgi:RNA polymerase sigma-70 factor (ECF subfamily)